MTDSSLPVSKRCRKCGEVKVLEDFYAAKGGRDGRRTDCKTCNAAYKAAKYAESPEPMKARVKAWQEANPERYQAKQKKYREDNADAIRVKLREWHLQKKYGITIADYDAMLVAQGGGCAICGDPEPEGRSLHVDHDHDDGRVRGLLCFRCNNALGDFREDLGLLNRATGYLDRDARDDELVELIHERVNALRDV